MKKMLPLALILLYINVINAQFTDVPITSTRLANFGQIELNQENSLFTKRIIPITLITTGFLLSTSDFEKSLQTDLRKMVGDDFYLNIDDYTRYAPVVQLYSADILGVRSRNHWFDQTKNLILSSIISNGTTALLKKEVYKKRPGDSTNSNSFPSGHTTTAFTTATVLYEEFKDTNPLLAYSGYFFAITTGTLRMLNNMHYLSDVLVGAGIGILSVKLVYHFEHLISWNPFKKLNGMTVAPQFSGNSLGFYLSKSF
ncbi:phosphatase PAP2 family protein [Aquimarina algiphila]|uniref:Phosphatase PAP2 family protein n=1 Tax=Aquimarina algiphila TaxID=2047982 RepID=A0A554VFL4_9FLAO|nr:phosphatase PAP2 family protein [Aquimarina algiphila]TSE06068.1 phosphatase PAP2 family protein [Aquimarina algiphila]